MASKTDDDDSFIILSSSPYTSFSANSNGVPEGALVKEDIEAALKDMPLETSMAFKAHFKLADFPSQTSMMTASAIISEDKSTGELQKRFGEILDENSVLRESLRQNNASMREQMMTIAACQEDMLRTHTLHREKFDETRQLVERLRIENKRLRADLTNLLESSTESLENCKVKSLNKSVVQSQDPSPKVEESVDQLDNALAAQAERVADEERAAEELLSSRTSEIEFVTSPDDDIINKLTQQLDLIEKQRRQVIVDNGRLTWQKESLERIIDAAAKEKQELYTKIKTLELALASDNEKLAEMDQLKITIKELQAQTSGNNSLAVLKKSNAQHLVEIDALKRNVSLLQAQCSSTITMHSNKEAELLNEIRDLKAEKEILNVEKQFNTSVEARARGDQIDQYEEKLSNLHKELKKAQLKILDLEGVKMDFTKFKSDTANRDKVHLQEVESLHNILRTAQSVAFQAPALHNRKLTNVEGFNNTQHNLQLYEKTVNYLSDLLNAVLNGTLDNLAFSMGLINSVHKATQEQEQVDLEQVVKTGLVEAKTLWEKQHCSILGEIAKIKGALLTFETMFNEYQELLQRVETAESQTRQAETPSVDALTKALVARGNEIEDMKKELCELRSLKMAFEQQAAEERAEASLMRAQAEVYKTDFQDERESREKLASDVDATLSDLRNTKKAYKEMCEFHEEVRLRNPSLFQLITRTKRLPGVPIAPALAAARPSPASRPSPAQRPSPAGPSGLNATTGGATGNMVYTCPKCMRFSSDQYKVMEDHFDFCLDDK